jgi:hypothetical protein
MITFKSHEELVNDAFYSCRVVGCSIEAEKLYSTETKIIDVCLNHYKELIDEDYR